MKVKKRLITRKQASCIVKCHDVVAVCTGDGFPYYLVKLSKDHFTTTESVKDNYGHNISAKKKIKGITWKFSKKQRKGTCITLVHQNKL